VGSNPLDWFLADQRLDHFGIATKNLYRVTCGAERFTELP